MTQRNFGIRSHHATEHTTGTIALGLMTVGSLIAVILIFWNL